MAKQRLADQCASLAGKVAYVVDLDTEWLAGDAPACLREFDAGRDTGRAQLFLVTEKPSIVEIQVFTGVETKPEQLHAGLNLIVAEANRYW